MPKALIVIAKQGFQDLELKGTRDGLVAGGFDIVLASTDSGPCTGKFGSTEMAQLALLDVDVKDYARIAFIGGPGAAPLADDPEAQRIARETVDAGIILGAICIAPTILAKADVLHGKRATVWNEDGEQGDVLAEHGATYTAEDVTVDGSIVTANGPKAAEKFGKTLTSLQSI